MSKSARLAFRFGALDFLALVLLGCFVATHVLGTNEPPRLVSPAVTGGVFRSDAEGRAGKRYRVEAIESLLETNWQELADFHTTQTNFSFTDSGATGYLCRFYRLGMLPATNPPSWPGGSKLSFTVPSPSSVRLSWPAATDLLEVVQYAIYQNGVFLTNLPGTSRTFTVSGLPSGTAYTFRVEAMNEDTNWTAGGPEITVNPAPPNPSDIAPSLQNRGAVLMKPSTAFLYTNSNPIQTGVSTGTIDDTRAAVVRGTVYDELGNPAAGVAVTVHDHPEYGQTVTRTNGEYDLAVNGGADMLLAFKKEGYVAPMRLVPAFWQEYSVVGAVFLTPIDTNVNVIVFPSNGVQIARGSVVQDASNVRQHILLFPPNISAGIVHQDGTTQSVNQLTIHITECTAGTNGSAAMPAELPPESEFTYAVDLMAEEAEAVGAKRVQFSSHFYSYLTNFLQMPVGIPVPQGGYNVDSGAWVADPDGLVIRFVAVSNGMAELDADGDGLVEDTNTLAALGFTDEERAALVDLYGPGWELWRAPLDHFTFADLNYGAGGMGLPPQNPTSTGNTPTQQPNNQGGYGTVELQNQVFHEDVAIVGTPFTLHYASDRAAGYQAGCVIDIPVVSTSIPDLQGIQLEIEVAGRKFEQTFAPATNLTYTFQWDGKDAYGRTLQGKQPLTYRIGYQYTGYYTRPPSNLSATFAGMSGEYITNPVTGERVPARQLQTLWQEETTEIGRWDMNDYSLGGWMLSVHHVFDPIGGIVYLGNGRKQNINGRSDSVMLNLAGTGTNGFSGDGGLGQTAQINNPGGMAVAPDGTTYIADTENNRIRTVIGSDSNTIITVVGTGTAGYSGDGGAGTNAQVNGPRGMTCDRYGNLYFADTGNNCIRKLDTNGVVTTVAGTGVAGYGGDDGAATSAQLNAPRDVAITKDGTLYVADTGNNRVRKVGTDGIMATVAGTGSAGSSGDGGSGQQAQLNQPSGVDVDTQGRVYIADTGNNSVRQLGRDGRISTYAGTGTPGYQGDGGSAGQAQLSSPASVSVGRGSTVFIADSSNNCVRKISGANTINTYGGTGQSGYSGNGAPPQQAQMSAPQAVSSGPDGRTYVADTQNGAARRMGSQTTPAQQAENRIASADGSVVYVFDQEGRHLATKHALTGENLFQFQYDPEKRLIGIVDRDGKYTQIIRDGDGKPTGIRAPYGQETALLVDTNGHLISVINPAGETNQYFYTTNGLLSMIRGPRGHVFSMTYDAQGYITSVADPAGGTDTFTRVARLVGREITETGSLGWATKYSVSNRSDDAEVQVNQYPDGTWAETIIFPDGVTSNRSREATLTRMLETPEPRFGMQSPLLAEVVLATPGGLVSTTIHRRAVMRSDPLSLFSLQSQRDEIVVNGRTNIVFYDATNRMTTTLTPAGRQSMSRIDEVGRLLASGRFNWAPVSYTHNTNGQLVMATQGTGAVSRVTRYGYNAAGWLAAMTNALMQTNLFFHDAAGRVTNTVLANGQSIGATYNAEGLRTAVIPPGRPAHRFGFSPVGLIVEYSPPVVGGVTNRVSYSWNTERLITNITRADGSSLNYTYNSSGQLTQVTLPTKTLAYAYNANGQVASVSVSGGGPSVSYGYDGTLVTDENVSGPVTGSVAWTRDNNFWVTLLTINGSANVSFAYNADGLLTAAGDLTITRDAANGSIIGAALGGVTNRYAYNVFGEVTNQSVYCLGTNIYSTWFTRDALGRITRRVETIGGVTETNDYIYDAVGQLTRRIKLGPPQSINDYFYDANGNRTNCLRQGEPPQPAMYDAQDRMTQHGSNTCTWSADGELTNKTAGALSTTYTYDGHSRLTGVVLPGGTNIEYVLDGVGRRVGKKVGGVLRQGFLYGGPLNPVAELDGSNGVVSLFVYGSRANVPDYMVRSGVTYRIVSDHLGSPRLVVNAGTGEVVQRMDYDEFGRVTQDTNPGFQPFGFAGGLYDPDTRLVHFGAREYDAESGRWTTRDPALFGGGGANLYAYAANDPANLVDASGLGPNSGIGGTATAGAQVSGVSGGASGGGPASASVGATAVNTALTIAGLAPILNLQITQQTTTLAGYQGNAQLQQTTTTVNPLLNTVSQSTQTTHLPMDLALGAQTTLAVTYADTQGATYNPTWNWQWGPITIGFIQEQNKPPVGIFIGSQAHIAIWHYK